MKRLMVILCVGALVGAVSTVAFADVVTPSNMDGWFTGAYDGNTVAPISNPDVGVSFVSGPAGQPLGVGSANLYTRNGTGDNNALLGTNYGAGTSLSAIAASALSYWAYRAAPPVGYTGNIQQFPYLALNINLEGDGSGSVDDTLFFEAPYQTQTTGNSSLPDQGATAFNTWQKWNASEGGWWDNNGIMTQGDGVNSLTYYLAHLPLGSNPVLTSGLFDPIDFPNFVSGAISFNVGFASSGDSFDGNVDAFTIGTTTFDFEPDTAPVPEPGMIVGLASLAGMGLVGLVWRRKQAA